jgi:hypothetical protein
VLAQASLCAAAPADHSFAARANGVGEGEAVITSNRTILVYIYFDEV